MRFKLLLFLCPALIFAEIGYVEPWGKDADISPEQIEPCKPISLSIAAQAAEKIILFHQKVLSPTTGPRSHFRPSSSHYALNAIRLHGWIRGYFMGCDRLLRENADPWVYATKKIRGKLYKWDPPPENTKSIVDQHCN